MDLHGIQGIEYNTFHIMYGLFEKAFSIQIYHFNKHTRIIKLHDPKISCKRFRTFVRSYYRHRNQVIVSVNILKRKCNIKDYHLSYYYIINLNVHKKQCCSKKQLKFFEKLLKRKLFVNTLKRFCQNVT